MPHQLPPSPNIKIQNLRTRRQDTARTKKLFHAVGCLKHWIEHKKTRVAVSRTHKTDNSNGVTRLLQVDRR